MLRDHAPKKAGFQHWPVRVADFNSHVARRLAANIIASQVGEDRAASKRNLERLDEGDQLLFQVLAATGAKLSDLARLLFGQIPGGWQRVQAICDYINGRIQFGYHHARCDRSASEGHEERVAVCRDFAHLATRPCRCMNIPARYCTAIYI